jgi:hypothetical protein
MFSEVKAEIIALSGNLAFTRNLSLTFIMAIACLLGLAQLASYNTQTAQQASITNISRHSTTKFIVEN